MLFRPVKTVRLGMALAAFLALNVAQPGRAGQQPADPQAQFARAVDLQQSGNLEGASKVYEELLKAFPDSLPALSNLGAVYARLGRFTEAIAQYNKALEIDPENAPIRFNLGLAYYKASRLRDASRELERVLTVQPENKNAAIILADCYLREGENKKVIALLKPMERIAADDPALLYVLGTALIRDNQLTEGQALVDRILRKGESAEAHLLLGTARLLGRDHEGAIKELERALELNPKLPSAHSYYGRTLMAAGDGKGAEKAFREELDLNPNDFQSNLYLGVLLKQDQELDEALNHFRRALELRPGAPEVRYQIGSIYVARQDWPAALEVLEGLVADEPNFVEAHVSLATAYYRLKRREDGDRERTIIEKLNEANQKRDARAAARPQELVQADRGDGMGGLEAADSESRGVPAAGPAAAPGEQGAAISPAGGHSGAPEPGSSPEGAFEAVVARAHKAREANDFADATRLYLQALEMKPDWAEGWWYLGILYYGADLHLEGRNAFRRLVALEPKGGAAWAFLGLCEYQLREYDLALDHLLKGRSLGLGGNEQLGRVTRFRLALLLSRFERFEESLKLLYGLAKTSPESSQLVEGLGIAALSMPYLPTELPPESRQRILLAGKASYLLATKQLEEAERNFSELVAKYPDTPNVHYCYGLFLLSGTPDRALKEFRRELELSPQHVRARLQIAFEYIARGEYAAGLPFAQQAVELQPGSFAARNALGRILLETGDVDGAVRELEEGVRLAPDSPETRYALARAYQRAGRRDDAARERTEFARLDKVRRGRAEETQTGETQGTDRMERPPI